MKKMFAMIEILFLSMVIGIHGFCDVKQCAMKGRELSCRTCIPNIVPEGVIRVNVTNNTVPMAIQTFSDVSWRKLEYLDIIEIDYVTVIIHGGTFSNLRSIKYLGLHLQLAVVNRSQIHNSAFDGLDSLGHLNLTACKRFSFEVLFSLFQNQTNFRNLKQLSLGNFNRFLYGTRLSLNDSFLESLGDRRLEMINVDETLIDFMSFNPLNTLCKYIKSISVKKAVITRVFERKVLEPCTALQHLDLNGIQFPIKVMPQYLLNTPTITVNVTGKRGLITGLYFMLNVQSLSENNFYHGKTLDVEVRFIFLIEIKDIIALKHLSLQITMLYILMLSYTLHPSCILSLSILVTIN